MADRATAPAPRDEAASKRKPPVRREHEHPPARDVVPGDLGREMWALMDVEGGEQ